MAKGKKEANKDFKYMANQEFNPERLLERLTKKCDKICDQHNATYKMWSTIDKFNANLLKVHSRKDGLASLNGYFTHYWANTLVREFTYMLWNAVYDSYKPDQKKAEKQADQALQQFEKDLK